MKKMYLIWIIILGLMLTGCTVSSTNSTDPLMQLDDNYRTDIQTFSGNRQGITLETLVSNDISVLGLNLSDYRTVPEIRERGEREIITIAVAEYRPTERLEAYLLFYLWAACGTNLTSINISNMLLSTNVGNFDLITDRESEYFNFVKSNVQHNIFVFRTLESHSIRAFVRHYDVGNLTFRYNDRNYSFDRHQSVTFRDGDDERVDFELNSVLVITDAYLAGVMVTRRITGCPWGGIWDGIGSIVVLPGTQRRPLLHFFNFNTLRNVDQILEIDIEFILEYQSFVTMNNWTGFEGAATGLGYSLRRENIRRTVERGTYTVDWLSGFNFEFFQTPAMQRFYDNEFGSMNVPKEYFDYQHSVLVHVAETTSRARPAGGGIQTWDRTEERIRELFVTRMLFESDGRIYNAFVIMRDGSVDDDIIYRPDNDFGDWLRDFQTWLEEFMGNFFEMFQRILRIALIAIGGILLLMVFIKLLPVKLPLVIKLKVFSTKTLIFIIPLFITVAIALLNVAIAVIVSIVILIFALIRWKIRKKRRLVNSIRGK